ncbi:cofilin [Naegleria gruberi]|uniref:Cofilin n=1 Tax=Naegleria gruberi TaxID=5762 RepID=D2W2U0_NAEGR|nr:cofilin [Naegleria gruberi]EFC36571.1 cofilin [Naegleria gruberi]|eukprot:XP_002669315.1 cofilin [Naegleria gruberi]
MAGVPIHDDVVGDFNAMKLKKESQAIKFGMTAKLDQVVVVEKLAYGTSYDDFINSLPDNDCLYAVVDFHYDNEDGHRQKMIFINWAPVKAPIKKKMVYAATKQSVKDKLVGISLEIQATDKSEVEASVVIERCNAISK